MVEGKCVKIKQQIEKYEDKCGRSGQSNKQFCIGEVGQKPYCPLKFSPGHQLDFDVYNVKGRLPLKSILYSSQKV